MTVKLAIVVLPAYLVMQLLIEFSAQQDVHVMPSTIKIHKYVSLAITLAKLVKLLPQLAPPVIQHHSDIK